MAINKVVYGDQTIIDLTDSTLSSGDQILSGTTAYDRSGVLRSGTAQVGTKIYDGDSTADTPYDNLFMDTVASGVDALIVGGITISNTPLYENSATTTSIGATTVSINANDYELFILVARRGTSLSAYVQTVFKKDEWSLISIADQYNIFRSLRVTDTTFEFTVCNKQSSYGAGNWTTDNSYIIPYRLYGIKSATAISKATESYKSGDILYIDTTSVYAGHLTNSAKNIEFYIPFDKPCESTSATLSGDITVRHVGGGYLLQNVSFPSGAGTVTYRLSKTGLWVQAVKSTAYSGTNNTPISVSFESATITFGG